MAASSEAEDALEDALDFAELGVPGGDLNFEALFDSEHSAVVGTSARDNGGSSTSGATSETAETHSGAPLDEQMGRTEGESRSGAPRAGSKRSADAEWDTLGSSALEDDATAAAPVLASAATSLVCTGPVLAPRSGFMFANGPPMAALLPTAPARAVAATVVAVTPVASDTVQESLTANIGASAASSQQTVDEVPLRFVGYSELRALDLAPQKGPFPKATLMAFANQLAHSRMRGPHHSIRALASKLGFKSGGDRTRALKYAALIEQVLRDERRRSGAELEASAAFPSLPPSPPSPLLAFATLLDGRALKASAAFTLLVVFIILVPQQRRQLAASVAPDSLDGARDYHDNSTADCPTGWTPFRTTNGHQVSIDGQPGQHATGAGALVRCFRMTAQFGTHHECATNVCRAAARAASGDPLAASQRGTAGPNATLARITSMAESVWLRDALLRGRDAWIGLYRTPGALTQTVSVWRWVSNEEAEDAPSPTLAFHGQPDSRYGREDCVFISGSTSKWDDYGCDLREHRCLCELGVAAGPTYEKAIQAHADARADEATAPRAWAALFVGGLMALPLANSEAVGSLAPVFHDALLRFSPGAARREYVRVPSSQSVTHEEIQRVRWMAAAVGSALLYGGLAPFLYHKSWGGWHALQMGPWVNYMPLAGFGAFTVVEAVPTQPLRLVVFAFGALCASLSAMCVAVLLQRFHERFTFQRQPAIFIDSPRADQIDGAACALNDIVLFAFAIINGYGVCRMWNQVLRPSSTPQAIYAVAHVVCRIGAGSSGGLLLLLYCAPIAMWDPDMIEHSHSFGVTVTAVSYVLLAMCCTRENITRFLGTASNAVQLKY